MQLEVELSLQTTKCKSSSHDTCAKRRALSRSGQSIIVSMLLCVHAGLIAYSATKHSPTSLEPAFLASGISHWEFARFELYRVNPPLIRMVAALPALVVGCETNWEGYCDGPGSRFEFAVGEAWMKANGSRSMQLLVYARWACLLFSLTGGYFAYRWAEELYGSGAGLVTLFIWTFEPNLLAHAELITPDCGCWSFCVLAGYTFWRWLKKPTWKRAALAGFSLGLAELTKMTCLVLFVLWPVLWILWKWFETRSPASKPVFSQLLVILFLALYILNIGYAFDGFGCQLKEFQFVSSMLAGDREAARPSNRFRDSWLGQIPIPLPKQYVLGFDSQEKDLEYYHQPSFLRGERKRGGWWYYYLYGLLVKTPCGLLILLAVIVVSRVCRQFRPASLQDELVLLVPAAVMLIVVSTQTAFNIHLRYAYPSLALTTIFLGQGCQWSTANCLFVTLLRAVVLLYFSVSSLLAYPHHIAYFNDFVGGPQNGHCHLQGSSFDWGQDYLFIRDAMDSPALKPLKPVLWQPITPTYNPKVLGLDVATTLEECSNSGCVIIPYQQRDQELTSILLKTHPHLATDFVGWTHGVFYRHPRQVKR